MTFKNGLLFLTMWCLVSCACRSVEASANGGHSEESPALRLAPFMVHVLDAGAVPGPTGPVSWPDADKGVPNATTHDSDIQSGCKHTARTKRDLATGGKQEVQDIINLFEQGKEKIKLFDEYKNLILVFGNTGVGKTSFVKWMTDDSSKLISVRARTTSGVFLMKDDDDKIGTSTTESKTIFPELFLDKETGMAYYDLPGFKDTRGPAHDIAVTYFIKKVVDHAKSVKMIFLLDYNSLTSIGSRSEFTDYIVSITNIIKDITKFQKSIAIIATKVKREYEDDLDDAMHVVEDDVYINNVGHFIDEVRKVSLARNPQSLADKSIIKFTDTLLEKRDGNYSKIGIFRLADQAGPVSKIPLLQKGKHHVEVMIKTKLIFTDKTDDDFGYVVSAQSLIYLYDLAEEISTNIKSYVSIVANIVSVYYNDLAEQVRNELKYFITDTNAVDPNISKVRESLDTFIKTPAAVSYLVAELKNVNDTLQLSEKINSTIISLGVEVPVKIISDISDQGRYFNVVYKIYSNTSSKKLSTIQLGNLFNDLVANITAAKSRIQENIKNITKAIEHHIKTDVKKSVEDLKDHFFTKERDVHDINKLYNEVRQGHDSLLETKKAANDLNPEECVISIQNYVISMNVSTAADFLSNATQYGVYLNFLQEVSSQFKLATNSFKCADELEGAIEYLDQSQKWYKFLLDLYIELSKCKIHHNINTYDITNLGIPEDTYKKVPETSLQTFLQKVLLQQDNLEYDNIKNVTLTNFKLASLKLVSNAALNYHITHPSCVFKNSASMNNSHTVHVSDLYDTSGFVNEFYGLEIQFYKLRRKIPFLPFYQSLLSRVDEYIEKIGKKNKTNDRAVQYLRGAIMYKINSFNNNRERYLVIDVNRYFGLVKNHVEQYKKALKEVKIDEYQLEYQNTMNKQIIEAKNFIEQDILPEIDNIISETDDQVQLLINETRNLQMVAKEKKKELIDKKHALAGQSALRIFLSVLNFASQTLALTGPVAAAVGAGIGMLFGMPTAESDSYNSNLGENEITQLPVAINSFVEKVTILLKNKQSIFEKKLNATEQELKKFENGNPSYDIRDIEEKIIAAKTALKQEQDNGDILSPASVDKMRNMRKEILELSTKKIEILKEQKANNNNTSEKKSQFVNLIEKFFNVGSTVQNYQPETEEVDIEIQRADETINKLEEYEANIYKTILPMISSMHHDFGQTIKDLQNKSHEVLDVSRWKIQRKIKDMQLTIKEITEGFKVPAKVMRCIEKLEYGTETVILLFDRIQDGYDKAKLARYIADLNSAVKVTNDPKSIKEIDELEATIKSSLVLQGHGKLISAFKQYIFPFAATYRKQFESLNYAQNTRDLVDTAAQQIQSLSEQITEDACFINPIVDNSLHSNSAFDMKHRGPGPFFVWKHNAYQEEITKLLKGQEITIKADIRKGINHNAIKFNEIGVRLKLMNASLQRELDEKLQLFQVRLIHLGNSYYRCGHNYYIISHMQQVLKHYLMKVNGSYGDPNDAYTKIEKNAPMLSPYTMWNITLYTEHPEVNFSNLTQYTYESIDLELVGNGQYLEIYANDVCQNLDEHYTVAGTIAPYYAKTNRRIYQWHGAGRHGGRRDVDNE